MSDHPADRFAARRANRRMPQIVVIALLGLASIVAVLVISGSSDLDRSEVYSAARNTAYELERTPVHGLVVDVHRAASAGNPGGSGKYSRNILSELRIEDVGKDSRGDLYEFTNADGDHPVCLAVRLDLNFSDRSPSFPTVTVTEGAC
ncbi:hypothetical protein ACQEVC_11045 [Plantactinospora sp. CA-294935]|uniref:hypothetical protein n=1 Tax=Plantactinospora sp. CA-294935 TaxID=3240012 RepID=UPI003D944829